VAARPGEGDILVLIAAPAELRPIATHLKRAVEEACRCPVVHARAAKTPETLVHSIASAKTDSVVIASCPAHFSEAQWSHFDLLRTRLFRKRPIVLVLTEDQFAMLMSKSPNVASWIGGAVWRADLGAAQFSEQDKRLRLEAFRARSGMNDQEVVRRAEEGTLPSDPEYIEWLILLDRADLVGNR
jgi:hypothetical protein